MSGIQITADQRQPKKIISENDTTAYTYDLSGGDIRVGENPKRLRSEGQIIRAGDSGPIEAENGHAAYATLVNDKDNVAELDLLEGIRVGRFPRRTIERPKDSAVRAGNSKIVNNVGTGLGSGSSSTEYTLADNTGPGVYRLQTVTLSEISGNWDPNIRVEIRIEDDTGAVTERLAANVPQLPFNFPTPVAVPSEFTAKAVVHNDSGASIDYRLNAAYTKEDI